MSKARHIPAPQRLAEQPATAAAALLRTAAALEPPSGAQERIWRRLTEPTARLAETPGEAPAVVTAVRAAAAFEPPAGAQERIWRRLEEQQAILQGVAEPKRLIESDEPVAALLARAADAEPGLGKQARIFRAMRQPEQRPVRWQLPFGVLAGATAAFLLVLHFRPAVPPAPQVTVHAHPSMALKLSVPASTDLRLVHSSTLDSGDVALAVGDSLVVGESGSARVQVKGVGDVLLKNAGTSVRVMQADDHGVRLELAQGRISVHADKRTRAAPLVIFAQGAEVEVVGTIFSVETTRTGPKVYVREGLVQVRAHGGASYVGPGRTWPLSQPMAPWATEAMSTLATAETPAAATVKSASAAAASKKAVAQKVKAEVTKLKQHEAAASRKADTQANVALARVELNPKVRAAPVGQQEAAPQRPVEVAVMPQAAPVQQSKMKPSPTSYRDDRELLGEIDSKEGKPFQELAELRTQLNQSGADVRQKIGVNLAITRLKDLSGPQLEVQKNARQQLAEELDSMGAILDATDVYRQIVADRSLTRETRANAIVEVLAHYVVLNQISMGLRTANAVVDKLPAVQRAAALVFMARMYANKQEFEASDKALERALSLDNAAVDSASGVLNNFALRASFKPELAACLHKIVGELREAAPRPSATP